MAKQDCRAGVEVSMRSWQAFRLAGPSIKGPANPEAALEVYMLTPMVLWGFGYPPQVHHAQAARLPRIEVHSGMTMTSRPARAVKDESSESMAMHMSAVRERDS